MGWFSWRKKPPMEMRREIGSPDGRVVLAVELIDGQLFYGVTWDGRAVARKSKLGIVLQGEEPLGNELTLVRACERTTDEVWETVCGEERTVRNNYNEVAFYLAEVTGDGRLLVLRARVFDTGVAFRYEIPPQPKFQRVIVMDELTEFNVDWEGRAWQIPAYQPDRYEYNYTKRPIYSLTEAVHTPMTVELPGGGVLAIHEAALYDYGAMNLRLSEERVLRAEITPLSSGAKAYVDLPFLTPWRVIMLAESAKDLTLNRMVLNLNEPPKEDFSWVKPLKFMGIWWAMYVGEWTWAPGPRHGATTEHTLAYIDACEKLGIEGLLIEGWNNGWEGDWLENGATSDFTRPMADFDVPAVVKYAREKGVKLVGHQETVGFVDNYERQLEEAYQYCKDNGISYIKPGYSGSRMVIGGRREFHHSQAGVKHYQRALEMAARHRIMLDVHEPIKGTGIERTWPNLLTREGARGQEYEGGALKPSHACILPFTRLLAGGMDYTSGILDVENSAKRMATTICRQLAYYVVIYSGMQMAADRPEIYEREPELFRFIREVPVNWERTVPLFGEIGVCFGVARQERDGKDWYVGGVTNEDGRTARFSLEFLDEGSYVAEVYRDAEDADYRNNPLGRIIEARRVSREEMMEIWMAAGGGFAMRIKRV